MADSPVRTLVKIGDPTTAANEAAVDASGNLTVILAANSGVDIGDVDIIGAALTALQLIDDPVAVLGTATYAEATTSGMVMGAVRNDVLATLVGVDNEIAPLQVDASGSLYVTGGGGGTEYTVNVAAPADPVGGTTVIERDDVLSTLTEIAGDWTNLRGTAEGALWVQDFNSDAILADTAAMDTNLGTIAGAVAGTEMQVDIVSGNVTNAGTFAVQEDGAALTALQLIDDVVYTDDTDVHATGASKGVGIMAAAVPTDAAVAANDIGMVAMSLDRRMHVDADITASVALDVSAATVTVDNAGTFAVQVVDTSFAVADGGALGEGILIQGDDGTDRKNVNVDATTGNLQVDVITGGGSDTPAGEVAVRNTASDVAVDATINVQEADAGGTTSKCTGFDASASVPIKAELQQIDNDVATLKVTLFAAAGEPIQWRAPHRDYFETAFGATGGYDGWRVVITNKDSSDAADVYGTIYTEN